jgi:ribonuclease P protein component
VPKTIDRITPSGFSPQERLRRTRDYDVFFQGSEFTRIAGLTIFRAPNTLQIPRLGITVKKGTPSVLRNKTKRQIREIFRKIKVELGCFDYNVVIRAELCVDQRQELIKKWPISIWARSQKRSRSA